jgi:hypothetical protein
MNAMHDTILFALWAGGCIGFVAGVVFAALVFCLDSHNRRRP